MNRGMKVSEPRMMANLHIILYIVPILSTILYYTVLCYTMLYYILLLLNYTIFIDYTYLIY